MTSERKGTRSNPVKGPLKRGDFNAAGTHRFWGYQPTSKNGEYWVPSASYDMMKKLLSDKKKAYYQKKKSKLNA